MNKLTYKQFKDFLDAYNAIEFRFGEKTPFLKQYAKKSGIGLSTLQGILLERNHQDWRKRYEKEASKKMRVVLSANESIEAPRKQVIEGVIINHNIMRRQWV